MTTNALPKAQISTPAHEWAEHTTGLLARPSGAESDTDDTSDYPAATTGSTTVPVSTPGPHLPGAYLESSSNATTVKDSVDSALDSAKQYIPAQADVQNALSVAAQSVKGYLPKGVVDYMSPPFAPTTTSLPSTETTGTIPYEHVSGVGALPGRISEAGVASLPHERVVDEARARGGDARGVGLGGNGSKGTGPWRESEDKGHVANEDDDAAKHARETWREGEDKGLALGGAAAVSGEKEKGKKAGQWRESEDKGRLEGAGTGTSPGAGAAATEKEKTSNGGWRKSEDKGQLGGLGLGAGTGGAGIAAADKEKKRNSGWRKSKDKGELGGVGAGAGALGLSKHEHDRDDTWRQSEEGTKAVSGTTDVGTAGKTSTTGTGLTGTNPTSEHHAQEKSTSERGRVAGKGAGQVHTEARTHALGGDGVTWGGAEIGPGAGEVGGKQGKDGDAGKDRTERKSTEERVREKVQKIQKEKQGGQDKETQRVDTQKPTSKQESDRDDKYHPAVLHPDTKARGTGGSAGGETQSTDSSNDKPSQTSSAHGEKKKVGLVDKMRGEAKVVVGKLGHREGMVEEGRRLVRGE